MSAPAASTSDAAAEANPPATRERKRKRKKKKAFCHKCKEEIKSQFIRLGTYKFHKDHFTCEICGKNLHGEKMMHKDDKFYCAEDFLKLHSHVCTYCGEKIGKGSMVQAFGGYYHPHHFVCATCNQPFKNNKYYECDGKPYCEEHFAVPKCDHCGKFLVANEDTIQVRGKVYHSACLACNACGVSLANNESIFHKEGKVYCKNDYLKYFCKRCTGCGDFTMTHCITVNDEYYHPNCLACGVCGETMDQYICVKGNLRCMEHAHNPLTIFACDVCQEEIKGDPVLAIAKKVHSDCFKCAFCETKLEKATCKLKDDQLACEACLRKDIEGDLKVESADTIPLEQLSAASSSSSTTSSSPSSDNNNNDAKSSSASGNSTSDPGSASSSSSSTGNNTSASPSRSGGKAISILEQQVPEMEPIEFKRGQLIGKGSFGKVYEGMNIATGATIAVKQIRLSTADDVEQAKTIQTEITLMQNLRHPNIVAFLGTQRNNKYLNILMEFVPAKSLDVKLEKYGKLPEPVIKSYTKQLLSALAYCHSHNVVHRDIKAKNILVDTTGHLKVADFGSAKLFEEDAMAPSAPSVGYTYTPLWTAPEVLIGDYNAKVDIWSLGCVMIEMATVKAPWHECNFENPFRALYHIGNTDSIPEIPTHLSDECQAFMRRALTRDPDQRPDAEELLQDPWFR